MIKRHIKSNGLEMTDAVKDYLEKKITGIEKFVKKAEDAIARVELGQTTKHHKKGNIFRAEINLEYGDHKFRAEATTDDLYKSIDAVKEEIVAEITKANKKGRVMLKKGKQKIKAIIKKNTK
ncbi:MAG: Ribosomal subunit interface protein [Candidatus Taylorbacteria bacterium]|nr:Ribosomal subunit interface protein [Candidatus Taylorbacteria bacterium]